MIKTAVLFDIDNTLTPPRQPITEPMVKVLNHLQVPFHVAAGSDLDLLIDQFFEPLYDFGFRKQFDAFLSNGAIHYRCDYSKARSIEVISSFNIREYLGKANYAFVIDTLKRTLHLPEFQLPPQIEAVGETIVFRGSMINFTTIGRVKREGPEAQRNRKNFVEFDRAYGYRQKILHHLKREWSSLIEERGLTITLGGQTSFDIGIMGKDKTNAVRTLLDTGVERLVFMGDALFEGGNDAAIREYVENWPSSSAPPVQLVQVDSYTQTVAELYEFGFIGVGT